MMRLARIRRQICARCPEPCAEFKAGKINPDDPAALCPVTWSGRWGPYQGHTPAIEPVLPVIEPATWDELHTYQPTGDPKRDNAFLDDFTERVRSFGCDCRVHWKQLLKANPVRWDAYFTWAVERHNEVNARLRAKGLNRPEFTVEAAQKRWKASP